LARRGRHSVVVAAVLAAVEALVRGNLTRDSAEREKRRRLARSLIEDVCAAAIRLMSSCPEKTAAVVFRPDQKEVLRTEFTYNKQDKPDRNLQFGRLEGATGHAWATGTQTVAKLSEVSEEELEQTWKLSPEYIRLTAHLKVVVATPIPSLDDPATLLGIVTVDSEVPDDQCGLTSEKSLDEALQLAKLLARILTLAELV
jgi:hypothetical protein